MGDYIVFFWKRWPNINTTFGTFKNQKGSDQVVFLKVVLYFFDLERTMTCFLNHQRKMVWADSLTGEETVVSKGCQELVEAFEAVSRMKDCVHASKMLSRKPSVLGCGTLNVVALDIYLSVVFDMPTACVMQVCVILSSRTHFSANLARHMAQPHHSQHPMNFFCHIWAGVEVEDTFVSFPCAPRNFA